MSVVPGWRGALIACTCAVALAQGSPSARPDSPQQATGRGQAAVLVIDLPSGRPISVVRRDLIDTRVAPGSVLKVATLVAALESGVVTPSTRFTCRRRVRAGGRELVCVHPDPGRPLTVAEALAYSCNDFFVTIAGRLPAGSLSAATVAMGLPAISAQAPIPLAAVGLAGIEATPDQLLRAFVRVTDPGGVRMSADTRRVLVDGLRGAVEYGTAQAIGTAGLDALAKTGTAPMPGGGYHGLVVAVSPAYRPTRGVVVLLPGGSGADAAQLAADALSTAIRGAPADTAATPPGERARPGIETPGPSLARPGKGSVRVGRVQRGGGYEIVNVPLEEYVARVIAAEAAAGSAPAALQALAVAVRTYTLANLGRHKADGFDLCDLTHCQVMGESTAASRQATAATVGQILTYQDKPASVFYSARCGGATEVPSEVWPRAQNQPYLVRHEERACGTETKWSSEIAVGDLMRALSAAGFRGDEIRDLRISRRSGSGRAALLTFDGLVPGEITGDDLRLAIGRTLGWQRLKSTMFDLTRTSTGYRFVGRGSGHGVGMCLVGAQRLAASGKTARQILEEYFPGTKLRQTGDTTIGPGSDAVHLDLVLPLDSEKSRDDIDRLVRRALAETAVRARMPLPNELRVVFHPTVESYSRQTGQPWWTAGAASAGRVDLLPVAVLAGREILEPTVRHEVAHVLTAPALAGRSEWVKEGAAIYFSRQRIDTPRGARPRPCPTRDELVRSPSAAALADAYARAAACYEAQIAKGRKWTDVK